VYSFDEKVVQFWRFFAQDTQPHADTQNLYYNSVS